MAAAAVQVRSQDGWGLRSQNHKWLPSRPNMTTGFNHDGKLTQEEKQRNREW